ncbi:DUF3106 domain-containing protein [Aquabacterium sp. A7-Y]|uniref:DUF3106 domain-containing protein n=1 Tax=Aquabacterium sp. A7-Y TaxID=1349605 RepID=UPI00223D0359|nr:DUF3106 domain-containing protein [Aquabacterium sp. A7-Y]MCW7541495.1 DUF3106 domain-containing protein [Aquabacterium sp. A7-Y]
MSLTRPPHRPAPRRGAAGLLAGATACFILASAALAAPPAQAQQGGTIAAPAVAARGGPAWSELSPSQQAALEPLRREWAGIDEPRKRKWLAIATRFPSMSADEKQRLQERMSAWVRLSPQERRTARINYSDAKDVSPQERRDRWAAYQALSEEERRKLARQAARAPSPASGKAAARTAPLASGMQAQSPGSMRPGAAPQAPRVTAGAPPSPTMRQARPGATTTSITKRPAPPWHQQAGMPKIAATPQFVDSATLLPRVGPQGVAASAEQLPARRHK